MVTSGEKWSSELLWCVWHPWKGKTPRKRGRSRKRDTKYGVAKVGVAFLPQRKHEPILQGGAVPGEAQHGRPGKRSTAASLAGGAGQQCPGGAGQAERIPALRRRSSRGKGLNQSSGLKAVRWFLTTSCRLRISRWSSKINRSSSEALQSIKHSSC